MSVTPPMHGDDTDEIGSTCYKMTKFAERLAELKPAGLSVQLAQSLLRYAAVGGPQHVLMCKPVTAQECRNYDSEVKRAWQLVLDMDIGDNGWRQAKLPLRDGGLGVGTISQRAAAAYLCSWTRTASEVLRRTEYPTMQALRTVDARLDL